MLKHTVSGCDSENQSSEADEDSNSKSWRLPSHTFHAGIGKFSKQVGGWSLEIGSFSAEFKSCPNQVRVITFNMLTLRLRHLGEV